MLSLFFKPRVSGSNYHDVNTIIVEDETAVRDLNWSDTGVYHVPCLIRKLY